MNGWNDIAIAITSSQNGVVLLCPFSITHTGNNLSGINVGRYGTKLICDKSKPGDRCVINGDARHLDINVDRVTVLGFDFIGSKYGAISTVGQKGTSIIDCNFYE